MTRFDRAAAVCAVLAIARSAPGDDVRYVAARQVLLTFAAANDAPVTGAELWVSTDAGRTWRAEEVSRIGANTLRYTAAADGPCACYLILTNAAGRSAEPPASGTEPHVRLVVDTVAPTFQLHAAPRTGAPEGLTLTATLVEENLGPGGVRVFYRTPGAAEWADGGLANVCDRQIRWPPPPGTTAPWDLRVVVTDLAGNRTGDELKNVSPEPAASDNNVAAPGSPNSAERAEHPTVLPAPPAAPVGPTPAEAPGRVVTTDAPLAAEPEHSPAELAQLKARAARFMGEGRYALAVARLEDALRLAPGDAHVLTDLGNALYHTGRYDEATARFDAALEAAPDQAGAIEGLALVAATQKRYPLARAHLEHLLRLAPESAETWLRYGDIEHRLGHTDQAIAAWKRVLTVDAAGAAVRGKAEKRLRYFDPARRGTPPEDTQDAWPNPSGTPR